MGYLDITRYGGLCTTLILNRVLHLQPCGLQMDFMDPAGFEPTASALQGRRSPN